MGKDFRICEYCGCNTNASIRACCNAGRDIDELEAHNKILQAENAKLKEENKGLKGLLDHRQEDQQFH